jgi:hypothetical protein
MPFFSRSPKGVNNVEDDFNFNDLEKLEKTITNDTCESKIDAIIAAVNVYNKNKDINQFNSFLSENKIRDICSSPTANDKAAMSSLFLSLRKTISEEKNKKNKDVFEDLLNKIKTLNGINCEDTIQKLTKYINIYEKDNDETKLLDNLENIDLELSCVDIKKPQIDELNILNLKFSKMRGNNKNLKSYHKIIQDFLISQTSLYNVGKRMLHLSFGGRRKSRRNKHKKHSKSKKSRKHKKH